MHHHQLGFGRYLSLPIYTYLTHISSDLFILLEKYRGPLMTLGVIPALVRLVDASTSDVIRMMAVWALSNLALDDGLFLHTPQHTTTQRSSPLLVF